MALWGVRRKFFVWNMPHMLKTFAKEASPSDFHVQLVFHRVHICDEHRCARGSTWNGIKPMKKKTGPPFCDLSMARYSPRASTSFCSMPGQSHIEPELDGLARMVGNGVGVLAWCGYIYMVT